jgi:glycolate dehydrogenase iron-sulfur subunit
MTIERDQNRNLDELLRRCVGCGLCLPHCATWVATGNEVHSPRGRLLLLEDLLTDYSRDSEAAFAEAFELCIGCRACETACPSGVPFSLLEYGQDLTSANFTRSSSFISLLNRWLDSAVFLKILRASGSLARTALRRTFGSNWRRRLDEAPLGGDGLVRLLGSMPTGFRKDRDLMAEMDRLMGHSAGSLVPAVPFREPDRDVILFRGCTNDGLMPDSTRRLEEILEALGCRIHPLAEQQCCGALAAHTGRPGKAARLQRANLQALDAHETGDFPVVVEAAGCGLHLKDYGESMQSRITDATILLDSLSWPQMRELPLRVVYHDPCHALHGQGIHHQPRSLLSRIPGLVLVEPREAEVCCGSGGAWGLNHPELSQRLSRSKAKNLAATGADLVVTSNPGCLGQINDGLAMEAPHLPIIPLTDLLWFACFTRKA